MFIKWVKKIKHPPRLMKMKFLKILSRLFFNNDSFSFDRNFGQQGLGEPDAVEILSIIDDDGRKKEFKYYKKGIHYIMSGGEKQRPIFQVFTHFMTHERS